MKLNADCWAIVKPDGQDGRFWCGMMRNPLHYWPVVGDKTEKMRQLVAEGLGFGRGCDSDDPE